MARIGKPKRRIRVEPLPERAPEPSPERAPRRDKPAREPDAPKRRREKVPA
jgi:hypothetical protein